MAEVDVCEGGRKLIDWLVEIVAEFYAQKIWRQIVDRHVKSIAKNDRVDRRRKIVDGVVEFRPKSDGEQMGGEDVYGLVEAIAKFEFEGSEEIVPLRVVPLEYAIARYEWTKLPLGGLASQGKSKGVFLTKQQPQARDELS